MLSLSDLPREILIYILKLYMKTESQYDLMRNISKVNDDFKSLCLDSILWETVDGSLPFGTMMKLIQQDSFKLTKNFTLSKIDELSEKQAVSIFTNLKNVNFLDFSLLKKMKGSVLELVAANCTKLTGIQFSKLSCLSSIRKKVNYKNLSPLLAVRGVNIQSLNLSYTEIQNMTLLLRCIADCCPNLEELIVVSVNSNAKFPTKYMQMKCQKLKVLCLDHNVRPSTERYDSGFPHLTAFTFFDPNGTVLYDHEFLSLLFNSPELKILNISYTEISSQALCQLPAKDVEHMNISRSKVCTKDLDKVIEKWCHSLKEVNVAYCKDSMINKAVSQLVSIPLDSQLEVLNLSNTIVEKDVVQKVLERCTKLTILHLDSCRNLSRGMKKVYRGITELNVLRNKINAASESSEVK